MEKKKSPKQLHQLNHQSPCHLPPPSPNNSTSSSSCSNHNQAPPPPPSPSPPPLTPPPITRSESNPYPTTFVQANTSSFKQVVQMLTGSSETAKIASSAHKPGSDSPPFNAHNDNNSNNNNNYINNNNSNSNRNSIPPHRKQQQQGFKLFERRNSAKNFKLSPVIPGFKHSQTGLSPRKAEILSPSVLDFPSLALSPVTPLMSDLFNRSSRAEEEKAMAEKGFYLHRSPATTPRDVEPPRLLPLFPVTSPRVSGSSSN